MPANTGNTSTTILPNPYPVGQTILFPEYLRYKKITVKCIYLKNTNETSSILKEDGTPIVKNN